MAKLDNTMFRPRDPKNSTLDYLIRLIKDKAEVRHSHGIKDIVDFYTHNHDDRYYKKEDHDLKMWYSGSGTPNNLEGFEGDFYIDLYNGNLYLKHLGSWNLQRSIIGPQGIQGPQGDVGPQGPQGPEGPQGPKGDTPSLEGYVKNTDYAQDSKSGVIKSSDYYGLYTENGFLRGKTYTYDDYLGKTSNSLMSKGTLENVISGKGLITDTDIASDQKAGIIKSSYGNGTMIYNGMLIGSILTNEQAGNLALISKGTLENIIKDKELTNKTYVDDKIDNIQALPEGGTEGQVLTKASDAEGDATWKTISTNEVFVGNVEDAPDSAKIIIENEIIESQEILDSLPIGAIVEYSGTEVPNGYKKVEDKGEIYSTDEIRIGTWIDGKPIYRKVIVYSNSIAASSTTTINISSLNIDTLVKFDGFGQKNKDFLALSRAHNSSFTYCCTYYIENCQNLNIETGAGVSFNRGIKAILEYTKTTD